MIHKYPRWAEVANYNIKKKTIPGIKTSKGLQWGRVKGLESRIARDPHSRTLGFIPRGDLRHFVVEGIYISDISDASDISDISGSRDENRACLSPYLSPLYHFDSFCIIPPSR